MSGRGRGRGFGRGRGGGAPEIKDDDGEYVAHAVAGPPLLYPENKELADRADPTEEEEELKAIWRSLTSYWQHSPYHLQVSQSKLSGMKRSLEDFQENHKRSKAVDTSKLTQVLTLHPKYFPEELYSSKERKASTSAANSAAQHKLWASKAGQGPDTLGLPFERLATLEAQRDETTDVGSPKAGEPRLKTEGDEDENPENLEVDEPDEEDFEDDDYLQGAEYDDDEGYEDDALEDDEGGAYY